MLEAENSGFKEKLKFDTDKKLAMEIRENVSRIKPYVFYQFDDEL